MVTITRKGLYLSADNITIPSEGSSDVQVLFNNDTETYQDYLIEPRVGYYVNGFPKSVVCEFDTKTNMIIIPKEAFNQNGVLVIAIALIDNNNSNHIEVTKPISFEVSKAPNETVILPADDTWHTAVDNLVKQLFDKDYAPQLDDALKDIDDAVEKANTASQNANTASQNVQNAYENLGDYKVENGVMYFKKADGTWNDEGVALAGQTTIKKDDIVQNELILSTQRTANPTYNIVQLKDINGNVFSVEVSRDSVSVKGKDGRKITQTQFNKLVLNVIDLMPFYIASPTSDLDELKNFI